MGSMFSKPKIPEVKVAEAPSTEKIDTAATEAAAREAERIRKRKGAASTIKTSPEGITESATTLKTKLGD